MLPILFFFFSFDLVDWTLNENILWKKREGVRARKRWREESNWNWMNTNKANVIVKWIKTYLIRMKIKFVFWEKKWTCTYENGATVQQQATTGYGYCVKSFFRCFFGFLSVLLMLCPHMPCGQCMTSGHDNGFYHCWLLVPNPTMHQCFFFRPQLNAIQCILSAHPHIDTVRKRATCTHFPVV